MNDRPPPAPEEPGPPGQNPGGEERAVGSSRSADVAPGPGSGEAVSGGASLIMSMGEGRRLPIWVWRLILAVAVSAALYDASLSILGKVTSLIGMVVVALFLSFAIEPAVSLMARRFNVRRGVGTFLCFLAIIGGTLAFAFVMAELVVNQVQDLIENAPGYLSEVSDWADDTFGLDINTGQINDLIRDYQSDVTSLATEVGTRALSLTGSLLGLIFQGFTVLLFAFYMTAEGPTMRRNFCSVLPEEHQRTVLYLWELSISKTGGWLYSRLLLAVLSAVFTWAFLAIMGVPSPLALAIWVGLMSQFIPAIGTYLAGALPVLIALLNDPVDALWVIGFILVYQQIENYFFSPKITAQTMDLHPAVAFGSAIAGGMLAGPIGAILALPAAGVIQAFVSTFLERHDVVESQLIELEELRGQEGDLIAPRSHLSAHMHFGGKHHDSSAPVSTATSDSESGHDLGDGGSAEPD